MDPNLYDKASGSIKGVSLEEINNFFKTDAQAFKGVPERDEKLSLYPLLYDLKTSLIPYTSNQPPIDHGNGVQAFDRETQQLLPNHQFQDCHETAIRHVFNIIFYNRPTAEVKN